MTATRPVPRGIDATRGVLTGAAQSLVATVLPLAFGLLALPLLTRGLGADRIALLLLAWSWLGVAQLLDLGLGRALVRRLAAAHAQGTLPDQRALVAATATVLLAIGCTVAIGGAIVGRWYTTRTLAVPATLRDDAERAGLLFCGLMVPTVVAAAPRAVLEAVRDFRTVSVIRLAVNTATFAVPLLLLPVSAALAPTAAVLLGVRCWSWWALHRAARVHMARAGADAGPRVRLGALLHDAGWITVSNILAPVLGAADRFVIGAIAGTAAVATYAVPHEAITKALFVPAALTTALFPALAAVGSARSQSEAGALHAMALRSTAALVLPALVLAIVAAPTIMAVLAGAAWPATSARILVWLSLGVAANALAMIPFTVMQAAGAARSVALLHLAETVPYVALLLLAIDRSGAEGAAIVWAGRVVVDAIALVLLAERMTPPAPGTWTRVLPALAIVGGLGAAMLAGAPLPAWAALGAIAVLGLTVPRGALDAVRAWRAGTPAR